MLLLNIKYINCDQPIHQQSKSNIFKNFKNTDWSAVEAESGGGRAPFGTYGVCSLWHIQNQTSSR